MTLIFLAIHNLRFMNYQNEKYIWNNKQKSCKDRFSNFKLWNSQNFTAVVSELQASQWITITSKYRLIIFKKITFVSNFIEEF